RGSQALGPGRSGGDRSRRVLRRHPREGESGAARQRELSRRLHRRQAGPLDRRLLERHGTARRQGRLRRGAGAANLQAAGRVDDAASIHLPQAEGRRCRAARGGVDPHALDERSRGGVDAQGRPGLGPPATARGSAHHRGPGPAHAAGPGAELAGRAADAQVGRGREPHAADDRDGLHRSEAPPSGDGGSGAADQRAAGLVPMSVLTRVPRRRRRGALTPYLFLAPGLLLFAAFRLYPLLDGLRLSFTNARLGRTQYAWVGLANYERLLEDTRFHASLWNTAFYTVASTLPVLAIPVALAPRPGGRPVQLLPAIARVSGALVARRSEHRDVDDHPDDGVVGGGLLPGDLSGGAAGHPAGAVRGGGHRRRHRVAELLGDHAAPPAAGAALRLRHAHHRVVPDLRAGLHPDPGRPWGRYPHGGAAPLRDGVPELLPLRVGVRDGVGAVRGHRRVLPAAVPSPARPLGVLTTRRRVLTALMVVLAGLWLAPALWVVV